MGWRRADPWRVQYFAHYWTVFGQQSIAHGVHAGEADRSWQALVYPQCAAFGGRRHANSVIRHARQSGKRDFIQYGHAHEFAWLVSAARYGTICNAEDHTARSHDIQPHWRR